MIVSFANKGTQDIYDGTNSADARKLLPRNLWGLGGKRLDQLNNAHAVGDMALPKGNKLEKLSGDRKGQWSVRINDQYRVCFKFEKGSASEVEVCDYH